MKYITLGITLFLVSCVQGTYKEYAFDNSDISSTNSGVILFRTVNKNLSDRISGFIVNFKNIDTGEVIKNVPGSWGYPKETEFALRVPSGEYELSYVFLYDGGVNSEERGFRVTVKSEEYLYIGTILKSWGLPEKPSEYGYLTAVKNYSAKEYCGFWACGKKEAEVYIFHQNKIPKEIFEKYPSIDESIVKIRLLK